MDAPEATRGTERTTLKRRGLIASAAALMAGIVARQAAAPVVANTGASLIVGQSPTTLLFNNFAQNPTALTYNGTSANLNDHNILTVHEGNVGMTKSDNPAALAGVAGPILQTGVLGVATTPESVAVRGVLGAGASPGAALFGYGGAAAASYGVFAQGTAAGVLGESNVYGGVFAGILAPLKLALAAAGTGHPASGAHKAGELYVDSGGALFYCNVNGTPGTWVALSTLPSFTALPTPERFVDTRINLGGVQGPVPAGTTHTFQMTGRAGLSGNPALIIPDSAPTILGNVTVIGAAGTPLGSFLTLWPGGTQPTVSNINYGPAATLGAVANSFVVALSVNGTHRVVSVFNQAVCDYLLDVTGYYV